MKIQDLPLSSEQCETITPSQSSCVRLFESPWRRTSDGAPSAGDETSLEVLAAPPGGHCCCLVIEQRSLQQVWSYSTHSYTLPAEQSADQSDCTPHCKTPGRWRWWVRRAESLVKFIASTVRINQWQRTFHCWRCVTHQSICDTLQGKLKAHSIINKPGFIKTFNNLHPHFQISSFTLPNKWFTFPLFLFLNHVFLLISVHYCLIFVFLLFINFLRITVSTTS